MIIAITLPHEERMRRWFLQAAAQIAQRLEGQIITAPNHRAHWLEGVLFDRVDHLFVEAGAVGGHPEGSVIHIAPRPPSDLR